MLLKEKFSGLAKEDAQILATDISVEMVNKTRQGEYEKEALEGLPDTYIRKYFKKVKDPISGIRYKAIAELKQHVRVGRLNLLLEWPMKGPFDIILCRNVMIYFKRELRDSLVERYGKLLRPGGHLFIGLSESLAGNLGELKYVQPSVYCKPL
jgi:chemotaxis protein methyltransferase CheR